jgi:hypothetical protein
MIADSAQHLPAQIKEETHALNEHTSD